MKKIPPLHNKPDVSHATAPAPAVCRGVRAESRGHRDQTSNCDDAVVILAREPWDFGKLLFRPVSPLSF